MLDVYDALERALHSESLGLNREGFSRERNLFISTGGADDLRAKSPA